MPYAAISRWTLDDRLRVRTNSLSARKSHRYIYLG